MWKVPNDDEMVTFEERDMPDATNRLEELVRDFETNEDKQWRKFLPRLEMSEQKVEGAGDSIEEEQPEESRDKDKKQQMSDDWLLPFTGDESEDDDDKPLIQARRISVGRAEDDVVDSAFGISEMGRTD